MGKKGLKILFNRGLLCLIAVVVSEYAMVKRRAWPAWGTCKTDSRYPERLIKDGKVINFHPFPSEKNSKNVGNCGLVLAAGQMTLNVRRIATYAAYILREKTGRPTKIQILFQLQLVEKRFVIYVYTVCLHITFYSVHLKTCAMVGCLHVYMTLR